MNRLRKATDPIQSLRRDTSSRYRAKTGNDCLSQEYGQAAKTIPKRCPSEADKRRTYAPNSARKEGRLVILAISDRVGTYRSSANERVQNTARAAILQLARVGNNLNQIARQLNLVFATETRTAGYTVFNATRSSETRPLEAQSSRYSFCQCRPTVHRMALRPSVQSDR